MMIYGNVGFSGGGKEKKKKTEEESRQCWSAGTGGRVQTLGVGAVPAFVWIFYLLDKTRSAHSEAPTAQSTLKTCRPTRRQNCGKRLILFSEMERISLGHTYAA